MTNLPRIVLGLLIGAVGGSLFFMLALPLPWMLGALFATMAAAIAGLPVLPASRIRPAVVAVIGVMLGARFTPDVVSQAGTWLGTVAILLVYVFAVAFVVVPFYRFVGRFDWTTAYFAGMPGGLTEMIEIGESKGADPAPIILAHSLRIVVTIALIALWFRLVLGLQVGTGAASQTAPLSLLDVAILLACAVGGSLMGKALRFPAPTFLGPLALSAVLHMTEVTQGVPPGWSVAGAQVILGAVLGCRFLGVAPKVLVRAGGLAIGATVLTLALAMIAGQAMWLVSGVGMEQSLLALAPGGLTEMGLIALAIHADVAFVALHHVARILFVIVIAPGLFRLFGK